MSGDDHRYSKQWDDLRGRIGTFFICWIGGFIAVGLVGSLIKDKAVLLFPVWAAAFFISAWRWSLFPCPRCQKPFFKPNNWSVNQLGRSCPHCGLKKWS